MQISLPVPSFDRRVRVPVPTLSPRELLFMGGAAALGVTEVLSAPVATVVAAAPLLRRGLRRMSGTAEAANGAGGSASRRGTARRTAGTRTRPAARSGGTSTARATPRRSGARSSRRSPARSTTTTAGTTA